MAVCAYCTALLLHGTMWCKRCGRITLTETGAIGAVTKAKTTTLDLVEAVSLERLSLGGAWDSVWGGGVVPSTVTLVSGPAGLGKTTILLQFSSYVAKSTGKRVYFLSAEQSAGEIKLTAERLGIDNMDRFRVLTGFGMGAEIELALLKEDPPAMFILDSLTALCGKNKHDQLIVAARFKTYSKTYNAPSFLVSHMNKEGDLAGLYTLQHDVDTLVTIDSISDERKIERIAKDHPPEMLDTILEGLRELMPWKNRYGATGKPFYLTMTSKGLVALADKDEKKTHASRETMLPPKTGGTVGDEILRMPKLRAVPDSLLHNGQKLVRRGKPPRSEAVEGEALKKKRPAMPRVPRAQSASRAAKKKGRKNESRDVAQGTARRSSAKGNKTGARKRAPNLRP